METPSSKRLGSSQSRLIGRELARGKSFATQLLDLLREPSGNRGNVSAEELATKILRSFAEALSVVRSPATAEDELDDPMPSWFLNREGPTSSADRTSEDSGSSGQKRSAVKDGRGCYKRRKMAESRTITSVTTQDNFLWRKYGQKRILNAKHPRCYYRCSHKHDQGCRAQKQAQRMEQDPNTYRITYIGQHTCKLNKMTSPALQQTSEDLDAAEQCPLAFESAKVAAVEKEESKEIMERRNHVSDNYNDDDDDENIPSLDPTLWPTDLRSLEPVGPPPPAMILLSSPSVASSYVDDVGSSGYSCDASSCHGLDDMEALLGFVVDFDNDLQFD